MELSTASKALQPECQIHQDMDEYRLLALSRIPRCSNCSRYNALLVAHETKGNIPHPMPARPADCTYQVCMPMVQRLSS